MCKLSGANSMAKKIATETIDAAISVSSFSISANVIVFIPIGATLAKNTMLASKPSRPAI